MARSIKPCVICYLPPRDYVGVLKFIENVKQYPSFYPTFFFSDHPYPEVPGLLKVDKIRAPNKDAYATITFMQTVELARAKGFTHFIVLEPDCRVTCADWDKHIVDEFIQAPDAEFGGFPVLWGFDWWSRSFQEKVIAYAYAHQQRSGIIMGFEGSASKQYAFYPNGALAIYSVAVLSQLFNRTELTNPSGTLKTIVPYDLILGQRLIAEYGDNTLIKVASISCIYSGCGEHHVKEAERIDMVKNKLKVAIHQIKRNDI